MAIFQERLEDQSLYYWLKEKFATTPFVNIVDGFPEDTNLTLPTVSVEWEDIEGVNFELGNRKTLKERVWYIDVFAVNKSQRDDFVYKIYNDLDDGVPVYNFNLGFPTENQAPYTYPTHIGTLVPRTRRIRNLHYQDDPNSDTNEILYFRAVVIATLVYDQF